MVRVLLTNDNMRAVAGRAAEIIRAGGVVLYPTDTLYGLGADALSDEAVAKIFEIKGRDEKKPVHAIVADVEMAGQYAEITDATRQLVERLPRGKVTFVCKKKDIDTGIVKGIDTFGFRIPDSELCIEMARAFGGPITATSANVAGDIPQRSVERILAQLGERARHIDLIIDAGELSPSEPSSVVDMTHGAPIVLREGAISSGDILKN